MLSIGHIAAKTGFEPHPRREECAMSRSESTTTFQLSFRSLFHIGRGFAFPCDAQGRVNLNAR
jgi:hypothetical protein